MGGQTSCCGKCEDAFGGNMVESVVARKIMADEQEPEGSPRSQSSCSGSAVSSPRKQESAGGDRRPPRGGQQFQVFLDKGDGSVGLGVDVNFGDRRTLVVVSINLVEGLVLLWNAAHPEASVRVGDRILAVNGIADDSQRMIEACKASPRVQLLIERPVA